jgi:hypothetical protein
MTSKEAFSKYILIIGGLPAIIAGGLLTIGGFLLFISSIGQRTEGSWVDPSGFGTVIGVFALLPGTVMLGLWYLSRLGPRNPKLTVVGAGINILFGFSVMLPYITNMREDAALLPVLINMFAPIFFITGISSLLGWWLIGIFNSTSGEKNEHES